MHITRQEHVATSPRFDSVSPQTLAARNALPSAMRQLERLRALLDSCAQGAVVTMADVIRTSMGAHGESKMRRTDKLAESTVETLLTQGLTREVAERRVAPGQLQQMVKRFAASVDALKRQAEG
jgi:hypothetical protein